MCNPKKEDRIKNTLMLLIGKQKNIEEQTKQLTKLIEIIKPDNIIFIVSQNSKKLSNNIIRQYPELTNKKLPPRNIITIKSNNLGEVYSKLTNQLNDNQKRKLIIDKTYASDIMNTAATLCKNKNPEILLEEIIEETDDGLKIHNENLDFLQLTESYKTAKKFFNKYQFLLVQEELISYDVNSLDPDTRREVGAYMILSNIYENFDKGEYEEAYKRVLEAKKSGALQYIYDNFTKSKQQIQKNHKALQILSDKTNKDYKKYYLASVLCDAKRRISENKLNDAILRLYRALTVVSEIELGDIPLDPYNINLHFLKGQVKKETYEKELKDKIYYTNGTYHTCGLTCNFQLLSKIRKYNEVGIHFLKNINDYYKIVSYRNNNKLAHGYNNATLEECEETLNFVMEFARLSVNNIDEIIDEVEFPEI